MEKLFSRRRAERFIAVYSRFNLALASLGARNHEDGRRESGGKIQEREGTEGSGEFVEEGVDNQGDKRR